MIAKCTCQHPGQDSIHGPGMRVFNPGGTPTKPASCTVCGAKLYIGGGGKR